VRPTSYIEINNFYTATVYEKGAEVIRMLKRSSWAMTGYEAALELYFDSAMTAQACTIEDWLKVFEDATGTRPDASSSAGTTQAGTPEAHGRNVLRRIERQCISP
jgi:aminopeptidase N